MSMNVPGVPERRCDVHAAASLALIKVQGAWKELIAALALAQEYKELAWHTKEIAHNCYALASLEGSLRAYATRVEATWVDDCGVSACKLRRVPSDSGGGGGGE